MNISFAFISQSNFFVPKDVRINSTDYLIMKINNKRQLQNIATNHFADIDYRDFEKIDKECTKEPHSFFTIDTTLPASDPLGFRKKLFLFYKIRVTDQFEMLDQKIKQHEA